MLPGKYPQKYMNYIQVSAIRPLQRNNVGYIGYPEIPNDNWK